MKGRTEVGGQRKEIGGQGSTDYADFHRLKKMRDERTEVGEKQKSEVGGQKSEVHKDAEFVFNLRQCSLIYLSYTVY